MAGKYELKMSADGQYHFTLTAANGEVILSSELYTSKNAAENGIESARKNALLDESYERKISIQNEPYFVL